MWLFNTGPNSSRSCPLNDDVDNERVNSWFHRDPVPSMAKSFSTYTLVQGKEPQLRRMVYEVRYRDGQLYLDRTGRFLKELLREFPEWVLTPEPTTQGTSLIDLRTGIRLALSLTSASVSLDRGASDELIETAEVAKFIDQAESLLNRILDELEVKVFERVGYREFYYFPFANKDESEEWLRGLGLFVVEPELYRAFGAAPDTLGFMVMMKGEECRYRLALSGVERSAEVPVGDTVLSIRETTASSNQKKALFDVLKKNRQRQINSAFSVVLDLDAFLLEPEAFDTRQFIDENHRDNLRRFRDAIPKTPGKKGK